MLRLVEAFLCQVQRDLQALAEIDEQLGAHSGTQETIQYGQLGLYKPGARKAHAFPSL